MRRQLLALLPALGLLAAVGVVSPSVSSAELQRRPATLSVSPKQYYQGEMITFSGQMPSAGVQRIRLQINMGRTADQWTNMERGRVGRTDATGHFRFRFLAPGMKNVYYRVASSKGATPSVLLASRWQTMKLNVNAGAAGRSAGGGAGDHTVLVRKPFTVTVDTTPQGVPMAPTRPLPGRVITLQKRDSGTRWSTIAKTRLDRQGYATFHLRAPSRAGTVSYRTRAADWTKGGSQVGWDTSFPVYVDFVSSLRNASGRSGAAGRASVVASPVLGGEASSSPHTVTAGANNLWGQPLFDFAWEQGESLTSKPFRGSLRKGTWTALSNGTGRVGHHNGGLNLDSGYDNRPGRHAHGNTSATLHGNARPYGRWEFRMRSAAERAGAHDYKIRMELVPENAANALCGGPSITIAQVSASGRTLTVGADSTRARKSWRYSRQVQFGADASTFAVEVMKDHVTWFFQGRPVATLKKRAVMSGVALTPRLSLYDGGKGDLAQTGTIYDWIRGWAITKRGKPVRSGHALQAGPLSTTCH